MINQNLIVK